MTIARMRGRLKLCRIALVRMSKLQASSRVQRAPTGMLFTLTLTLTSKARGDKT